MPGSPASHQSLLKQTLYLLENPKANFPLTVESKKYQPFPIFIEAEGVSSLVSNSPKRDRVFLLQPANFRVAYKNFPLFISARFPLRWSDGKGRGLPAFLARLSRKAANSCSPGTTIPRRHLIFPQTRNRGSLALSHLSKGFLHSARPRRRMG